jgi:putative transposase
MFHLFTKNSCHEKSKFIEVQILFALEQAKQGVRVEEVCRKMCISDATFYNRKMKHGELGASELRRLRQHVEENARLKRTVTDLSMDKEMLQDVKKELKTALLRGLVQD